MIFNNLSILQNVLFLLSCVSLLLLVSYLILLYTGYVRKKSKISSDDFDDITDDFKTTSFIFNTFKIKGSIFFFAIAATGSFLLSLFASIAISISVSVILAFGLVLLMGYLEREPLAGCGEIGIVTENIPEKGTGLGKVLLLEAESEVDAEAKNSAIKKGKKVIILENIGNKVIVEKYKRSGKK